MGEFWVKRELRKLSKEYMIINDIMLVFEGASSQIDHVIVSKYGIFVIETKQYNAYVVGNDYDKKWYFQKGRQKIYINNPIHQNYGHVQTLKNVLNIDENLFVPIVCISGNAKVKTNSNKVARVYNIIDKIKAYETPVIANPEEIYERIVKANIIDKESRKQHVHNVRALIQQKEIENQNKCPRCGKDLVERTGKKGQFIGCSNFPRCKFTKNI